MNTNETYLGDAVYASFDGWQIKLRTGDGNNQVIYLEPGVYASLERFAAALRKPPDDDAPYCSYGHRTKESCDCEPIASNE
jgi:hypothetical protein